MKSDLEHAMELAAALAHEAAWIQRSKTRPAYYAEPAPHLNARHGLDLIRIGKRVATRAVRACNGEGWEKYGHWTEKDKARRERADAKAQAKAQSIADEYGARVELGGDPRGYVMRLHMRSGRKNGWGDGWGVA